MTPENLDNPDWEPPSKYLCCPVCMTDYEWYWDAESECWWPEHAEWWFNKDVGLDFICSRKCYLKNLKRMAT